MTPQVFGSVMAYAILALVGLGIALFGFLRRPTADDALEQWFARNRLFFRVGGSLVAVVGVVLIVVALRRVEPPKPVAEPPETEAVWTRHTSGDGVWSAEFPAPPLATSDGFRLYGKASNQISGVPIPPELEKATEEEVFASLRGSIMSSFSGEKPFTLITDRRLVVDGSPAGEWEVREGEGEQQSSFRHKAVIRGGKIYRLIATNRSAESLDRNAQRFLDSFRFEPPKP